MEKQVKEAKKVIRRLKKSSPRSLPEFQRLENALANFKAARKELRAARIVWRNLGR